MTLVRRRIDVTFQLQDNDKASQVRAFQGTDANTVKVTGLRVSASIQKAGLYSMGAAQVRIYGLSLSIMNQLAVLGRVIATSYLNAIQIEAGDDENGMAIVFQGHIRDAYADLNEAPDSVFLINAFAGMTEALTPGVPTSFRGSADVATLMSGFATQAGLLFQNNGVNSKLADPYFSGSIRDQMTACAQHANINAYIDNNTLYIWPAGSARDDQIPKLDNTNGLVGYPQYTNLGVRVRALYTPSINYGTTIELDTEIVPAKGRWTVYNLQIELESETPGGAWFMDFDGSLFGHDVPAS